MLRISSALSVSVRCGATALIQTVKPSAPEVEMKSVPLVGLMPERLQQVEELTYYQVTFRCRMDGSGSWHWTSLLLALLWVGSADQRDPHDHPFLYRQGNLVDRASCNRNMQVGFLQQQCVLFYLLSKNSIKQVSIYASGLLNASGN